MTKPFRRFGRRSRLRRARPARCLRQAGRQRAGSGRFDACEQPRLQRRHRRRVRAVRVAEREGRDRRLRHRHRQRRRRASRASRSSSSTRPWEGIFNALQAGRPRPARLVDHDHRRTQALDGLQRSVLRCPPADRGQDRFEGRHASPTSSRSRSACRPAPPATRPISKLQGKNSADIKRFESTPLALKELEAGGIDAVVADNGVVVNYVKQQRRQPVQDRRRPGVRSRALRHRREEGRRRSARQAEPAAWRQSAPTAATTGSTPAISAAPASPAARLGTRRSKPRRGPPGPALEHPRRLRAAVPAGPV